LRRQHECRDEDTDKREQQAETSSGNQCLELRGVFGGRETDLVPVTSAVAAGTLTVRTDSGSLDRAIACGRARPRTSRAGRPPPARRHSRYFLKPSC
jgi:hypothetical protein